MCRVKTAVKDRDEREHHHISRKLPKETEVSTVQLQKWFCASVLCASNSSSLGLNSGLCKICLMHFDGQWQDFKQLKHKSQERSRKAKNWPESSKIVKSRNQPSELKHGTNAFWLNHCWHRLCCTAVVSLNGRINSINLHPTLFSELFGCSFSPFSKSSLSSFRKLSFGRI